MKGRELKNLGLAGAQIKIAQRVCQAAAGDGLSKAQIRDALRAVVADPDAYTSHAQFAELAELLSTSNYVEREEPAPWEMWGEDLDEKSIEQMRNACRLPVARRGALMPDAHLGYGLPIGGVLATKDAIIPYAVGVDIACRMRLTVLDIPVEALDRPADRAHLIGALEGETAFGIGAHFPSPRDHAVMDQDWGVTEVTARVKGKARSQLGSSGSGNHFVEYGVLTLSDPDLGLEPGRYLTLLSHSGSRGAGATVANHYSKLARELRPELPPELKHLAWLDMDSEHGQEYWAAMSLMGDYAAANHEVIHREMVRALGADALATVENHHNFCIAAEQLIPTPNGPRRMEDVEVGDRVYSMDEDGKMIETEVLDHWSNGARETVEVVTRNRVIRCTPNHSVLTVAIASRPHPERPWMSKRVGVFEWKEAGALERGDVVVCATTYYGRGEDVDLDLARFCGAFLADGWVRQKMNPQGYDVGLAIGSKDDPHTEQYKELVENLFDDPQWPRSWRNNAKGAFGLTCTSKFAHTTICNLGLGGRSREVEVPSFMFEASREAKLAFLAGYVDGDGSVSFNAKNAGRCTFASVNEVLIRGVRELAIGCGLQTTPVSVQEVDTNFGHAITYRFVMAADSASVLPLWHERKASGLRKTVHGRPEGLQESSRGYIPLADGFMAQRVREVRPAGVARVYDLTVEADSHAFVCEGMVVHNCWKEVHDGEEVYVHRKGATPAGVGVLGIIPGSMATPAYVVRGRGEERALRSASHGAGRVMSRRQAHKTMRWSEVSAELQAAGVELLSAGLDESPGVYKDINTVMNAQQDLVDVVARFQPKIVKMAPHGERPED